VKLTDTQLVLLSAASQRDDRVLERPSNLTGGSAGKVVARLLTEGLIEEIQSRGSLAVWRRAEDGARSLRITRKGLQVIRVLKQSAERRMSRQRNRPPHQRNRARRPSQANHLAPIPSRPASSRC
jgi:hypothetical protein